MSTHAPDAHTAAANIPADENRSVTPNFITDIIDKDLRRGKHDSVVTRWPPEPNGYLHIGHAKSICLNFGLALDYRGVRNLRFDDTNPTTEDVEYVESIQRDIRWLGFDWGDNLFFASDYFETLYNLALRLIEDGKAYVDSLSEEEIREYRGTVTEPGRPSPYRARSVDENLDLFKRMRAGEFADGTHVLRAKIDMAAPNMKMRDPLLYRIRHAHHYRTGDAWPIYPLYDFAHGLSDAIEGVTHSLCTLEFENNREIYDWLVDALYAPPRPHQYEFARLALDYTVLSKRKLITLVRDGHVDGWDDPRMPTLAGLRRRGVRPEAIRDFANRVGVAKANSRTDPALLEYSIRDDLNTQAPRVMAVLNPLKVVLTNYPEDKEEALEAPYWPYDVPKEGTREVPFARELFIERDDFLEEPPKGFRRLAPGGEVRLRYAYVIRCDEVVKDETGNVTELHCSYDPDTLGRNPKCRKVKGTVHWVSAAHALPAEMRLYDRLFSVPNPDAGDALFTDYLNPDSLVVTHGFVEPSVAEDSENTRYQFERQGYFVRDPDSSPHHLVFNRIVPLKSAWDVRATEDAQREVEERAKEERAPKGETEPTKAAQRDPTLDFTPEQRSRLEHYTFDLGLSSDDAAILAAEDELSSFFEEALETHNNPQGVANWIVNELLRALKDTTLEALPLRPAHLGELVALVDDTTISSRIAKEVFEVTLQTGESPKAIVKARGLEQVTDVGRLEPIVDALLAKNPDKVAAYRGGKGGLLGFFVGGVMRETQGKANPQLVQEMVQERLQKE